VSAYVVEQRRIAHRGRDFHFVSYEGRVDKATKTQESPMWFLMSGGKRWQVMEQQQGQPSENIDRMLVGWLDKNIFG
jgi:hypothetical protein